MNIKELFDDIEKDAKDYNQKFFVKLTDKIFGDSLCGYRPWHTVTHPWIILIYVKDHIKWAWQRVFVGHDERVVWSVDYYLAEKIPQWLRELKVKKQGTPMMVYGANNFNKFNWDNFPGTDETADRKYNAILDTIIEGFELYANEKDEFYENKDKEQKFNDAMTLFVKYFGTFWD